MTKRKLPILCGIVAVALVTGIAIVVLSPPSAPPSGTITVWVDLNGRVVEKHFVAAESAGVLGRIRRLLGLSQ